MIGSFDSEPRGQAPICRGFRGELQRVCALQLTPQAKICGEIDV